MNCGEWHFDMWSALIAVGINLLVTLIILAVRGES